MTNEELWELLRNLEMGKSSCNYVEDKIKKELRKKDAIIQAQEELITWLEWQVDEWGLASRRKYEQLIKRIEEAKKWREGK